MHTGYRVASSLGFGTACSTRAGALGYLPHFVGYYGSARGFSTACHHLYIASPHGGLFFALAPCPQGWDLSSSLSVFYLASASPVEVTSLLGLGSGER